MGWHLGFKSCIKYSQSIGLITLIALTLLSNQFFGIHTPFMTLITDTHFLLPMTIVVLSTPLAGFRFITPLLGRSLLLPKQISRPTVPAWLFSRLSLFCLVAGGVWSIPLVASALWENTDSLYLMFLGVFGLWGISFSATFAFWRIPNCPKNQQFDYVGLIFMFLFALTITTDIVNQLFFTKFVFSTCLTIIGLAFIVPIGLLLFSIEALVYRLIWTVYVGHNPKLIFISVQSKLCILFQSGLNTWKSKTLVIIKGNIHRFFTITQT